MTNPVDPVAIPVLEVRNLVTRFRVRGTRRGALDRQINAVNDVSLTLRAGETLSLVGESGCGKSTTARSIIGLAQPSAGEVVLKGRPLDLGARHDLSSLRRTVQMIFQDPFGSLNPRMRIGESIAEPLQRHAVVPRAACRDRVGTLLEQVGLSRDMAARFPHALSGGQRQRVCIARALAVDPQVLIADEAVSALDVSIKAQIVNLLLDLQERFGLSLLFISHDMAVVERVSHRVAIMYQGRIVEIGPRAAIFGNPAHPYTRQLLAAVPTPDPSQARRQRFAAANARSNAAPGDVSSRHLVEVGRDHFAELAEHSAPALSPEVNPT